MGLDAVVYRNIEHFPPGTSNAVVQTLPETGEVLFQNEGASKEYQSRHAVERRLGNLTEVDELRGEIEILAGPESLIIDRVLYSGTHSGDYISLEHLSGLEAELIRIRAQRNLSPELERFLASMEDLIRAAYQEGNPIVFI